MLDRLATRVVMGAFPGPELPPWAARLLDDGLGSVCVFGSNVRSADGLARLATEVHDRSPDVLVATDEEGGDVTRMYVAEGSPHPGNAALGAADDADLTERVAAGIGTALAGVGIDLDLAPVVDANTNPANPVIGVRSFGAEPTLVARHAAAYVAGLQGAGVGACVKHFPGHGDTGLDSHLAMPVVDVPVETLRDRELVPFEAAIAAGAIAVMTSHVLLPALDGELPATLSRPVLSVLRDDLGFDGLVVSDALDMRGASAGRGEPAAAVLAVVAGCDLVCLGADKDDGLHRAVVRALVDAVRSGELAEERLAAAADRVVAAAGAVRTLREAATVAVDDAAAAVAARRALRVTGAVPALTGATVLRIRTGSNVAVGDVPWGLPPDGRVLGGRPVVDVLEVTRYADVRAAVTDDRPLVVLVREPHRHPWARDLLRRLAHDRPDVVVVEMGWPGPDPLPGTAVVSTYGAGRVNGAALDELLAGAG